MTSVFLAENTQDGGTIESEEDFCAAVATLFVGAHTSTATFGVQYNRSFTFLTGAVDTVSPN